MASSSSSVPPGGDNSRVKIAVIQLNSIAEKEANFATAQRLIEAATADGARMAFLPECFDAIFPSRAQTLENGEPVDGPTVNRYRDLARSNKIWLSLGGLHEKNQASAGADDKRLFNAHIVVDDRGEIVSVYRKVHLFNLDIPGTRLVESEFSQPGRAVISPVATPAGALGLGICYDLRFAEFAIALAKAGADIISYPSSFTVPTGKAHWETLLRARAIETQCYVVAAGQVGKHNEKRSSYGHSLIIDPWGVILAHLEADTPGYATAEVDLEHLADVRRRLPVWTDRRPALYGDIRPASGRYQSPTSTELATVEEEEELQSSFAFGPRATVQPYQIFARTPLSVAFVNHRPVLPGHVLVCPRRPTAKRMADLTADEVADLFRLVQAVQTAVERAEQAAASTIAVQDGAEAGQSVEHLHVHIVPRKGTDFGGQVDEIWRRLATHDKEVDGKFGIPLQTQAEMTATSQRLRQELAGSLPAH